MYRNILDLAKGVRRSEEFKYAVATPRRLALHATQHLNRGVFSIEIHEISGLFSVLQMVVFILMYCEEKGLTPQISARGRIYGDAEGKTDWFSELFETVQTQPANVWSRKGWSRKINTSKIEDLVDLGFRKKYERLLEIDSASRLFLSHYRPAASIATEVRSISQTLGLGTSTLGVHFRGTDKKGEAVTVSRDQFCDLVACVLKENPHLTSILVSSDELAFIEYFSARSFGVPVKLVPARYLASGTRPVHFSGYPGLEIAREALISCLLLANCGFLIKTPSYLSAWSKIFNPALPVRLSSPPLRDAYWFPDSRLWDEAVAGSGTPVH